MQDSILMLMAMLEMFEKNGIELTCNEATKQLAYASDFETKLIAKRDIESKKIVEGIVGILENKSLDDFECVEEIICLLNEEGMNVAGRHDF